MTLNDDLSADRYATLSHEPPEEEVLRLRSALERVGRSERELADTFENSAVAIHWVGPDGTILRANQAELDLLGYTREEYVGRNIADFHCDAPVIEELLARLDGGEVVRNFAASLRCKDGSVKHVLIDSSVYREGDRFIHARCFTRDVSAEVAAQERWLLAAAATGDLIWDWDVLAGEVTWTGAVQPYFGGGSGSGPVSDYRAWAERVHPEDLSSTRIAARVAMDAGADSWEDEYRFRRTDGTYACMLERARIVRDAAGRVVRIVGALRDVSHLKRSEEATLRLAAIVASASDAIVGKTPDGVITSWNAAAERIFGYTEREMVGQSVFTLVPEELHETERALLARVRRGERVDFSVTERFRKDGNRIAISLTLSPIWDPSGVVLGISSIQRDVTERLRAQEELARREERYRALVMATTSVVWTSDPEGRFVERQAAWEDYTGQPPEDHQDFGWIQALHTEDREALRASWARARQGGSFLEGTIRVWHRGKHRYRQCVIRAAAVHQPDGSVREWVGTLTDVEDQRLAEERLRQGERLESVGRLAGGVAHEANNQMTVVMGAVAFLLRQITDDGARQDLEHIRRAAQRTAAITHQLLAFSRRQVLQLQVVDLNATVERLEPVLQRALGETSRLVLRLDPRLGRVKADPGQMDQVLLNLTLNARDAMPGGGVLSIETGGVVLDNPYIAAKGLQTMLPGHYALLVVSDTGMGMDRDTLEHVFEPFFTTKAVGEGTGLGLATVYGIVKQSGGFIWAYSEPGEGTTFKIYLPVAASRAADPASGLADPVVGGAEVVLLAEDDDAVRGVVARSLREYGYTVLEARDGAEALEIAAATATLPNLVIADVVMPRINGNQLYAEIQQRWPETPVLFISGYTRSDTVSRGLIGERCEFLQKPMDPEQLARTVRRLLQARKRAPS
jgi:two-component system cell cycle sensor histidine kinase/response regulator CckA